MKILQINTTINSGSTGRITEEIGKLLISKGHESYVAYGRGNRPSKSYKIKIGNKAGQFFHLINTRLFDRHGLSSAIATKKLIKDIEKINPDIIHLHNIHGYYINYKILFNYLKDISKPIVWTLHDCWPFTGHCTHFERFDCRKWQMECNKCPLKNYYPASIFIDRAKKNYYQKKSIFNSAGIINIICPSKWLAEHVKNSFLNNNKIFIINNGLDLNLFNKLNVDRRELQRKYNIPDKKILLGVANTWKGKKALLDFRKLGERLNDNYLIILIGLKKSMINGFPDNIIYIERTENINELVDYYNIADVFINPTYADTIPTTNIEALACGTPVITYDTGGSPETVNIDTGIVVEKGNVEGLRASVFEIFDKGKDYYSKKCRERAERYYNKDKCFSEYLKIYIQLIEIP